MREDRVLWLVVSRLFAFALTHFAGFGPIYGALGSAVILLTWLWLSSMSLLLAAEINAVLAEQRAEHGAVVGPTTPRSQLPSAS